MKRFFQLARDEGGSILILAAFGLLILIAILALSIDHGRNYLNQSDLEAKLTALTKAAGNEFTYWEIRQQVTRVASQTGMPPVSDEDCNVYVLCHNNISEGAALSQLAAFVQAGMQKTNPGITIQGPVIKNNSQGQRYLLFTALDAQKKDFSSSSFSDAGNGSPTSISVQSGVIINKLVNRTIVSQIVMSLDADSKSQLSGGTDQVKQVFDLVKTTVATEGSSTADLKVGLTLGNVPVKGPLNGSNVAAGGLDCTTSDKLGYSGGCHDNKSQFDGTDIGTIRIGTQSRKYIYQGVLAASDALTCANPVWVYRNIESGSCKYPWSSTSTNHSAASEPNCAPPPPPVDPIADPTTTTPPPPACTENCEPAPPEPPTTIDNPIKCNLCNLLDSTGR